MSSAQLKKFSSVKPAEIEWRDGLPYSQEFKDVYFSVHGAIEESTHVFINGNQLLQDWQNRSEYQNQNQNKHKHKHKHKNNFIIGELGFGCGLNFFNTLHHWRKHNQFRLTQEPNNAGQHLHYLSIEKRPLSFNDLKKVCERFPELKEETHILLKHYPSTTYGKYQIEFTEYKVTLTLYWMPLDEALKDLTQESLAQENKVKIDHWFLDGFAPSKNSSMWGTQVAEAIANLSKTGTRFATYSVAGAVKQPLSKAGFKLKKIKGFAKKREMLTGVYTPNENMKGQDNKKNKNNRENHSIKESNEMAVSNFSKPTQSKFVNIKYETPWFNIGQSTLRNRQPRVAVIGSGIAGCATAYSLNSKGITCELFESSPQIASGASKAAAGIFHPSLTSDMNIASQFNWQSYLYLIRFIDQLSPSEQERIFVSRGVNRILEDAKSCKQMFDLAKQLNLPHWIRKNSSNENKRSEHDNSILFPHAGVIDIANFCQLLLNKLDPSLFKLNLNSKVDHIEKSSKAWTIHWNETSKTFDHIIFCGGAGSRLIKQFYNDNEDTLHITKGQTCHFQSESLAKRIPQVLSEKIYLSPHANNQFQLGASFERMQESVDVEDVLLSPTVQVELLNQCNQLLDSLSINRLSESDVHQFPLQGTLGYRLHSNDRLPMVGAVPDHLRLKATFKGLGQKRLLRENMKTYNQRGLWLNTAYGSHGLMHCLISGAHIASMVDDTISPLETKLSHAVNPLRFLIKQVKNT